MTAGAKVGDRVGGWGSLPVNHAARGSPDPRLKSTLRSTGHIPAPLHRRCADWAAQVFRPLILDVEWSSVALRGRFSTYLDVEMVVRRSLQRRAARVPTPL